VKAEATTFVIEAQALIAQPGRNTIGPQHRREKVTLCVAETASFVQNFRRRAGHRTEPIIAGMSNLVSNPFKATASYGNCVSQFPTQYPSLSHNAGMLPVDYVGRLKKCFHLPWIE
jgi:hypothetical protein